MILERHARYTPVMSQKVLMAVISFYDVAKAVVDSQNFEKRGARLSSAIGLMKVMPTRADDKNMQ